MILTEAVIGLQKALTLLALGSNAHPPLDSQNKCHNGRNNMAEVHHILPRPTAVNIVIYRILLSHTKHVTYPGVQST